MSSVDSRLKPRKPCPFCKEKRQDKLVVDGNGCYVVFCESCGAEGPWANTGSKAVKKWNKRPLEKKKP